MSTRSKWLDWTPSTAGTHIIEKTAGYEPSKPTKPTPDFSKNAKTEPSKPTKPTFDGFVGSTRAISPKIEIEPQTGADEGESNTPSECKSTIQEPTQEQIDAAGKVLARGGVRLIGGAHGADAIGVWSDLDGPEIREAIPVFHPHGVPVRYLDGDVPMKYKLRRVPGEPVPANVLAAMKREPWEPWKVRDKMLAGTGWNPEPVPWARYQAERLNKLFEEQGVLGQPGKISATTVRHGERGWK
jgi:hypothetical protein